VSEAGATTAALTLTRSGPIADPLAVSYTVGGTAAPGSDYAALSGVVTFAANESSTTITIAAVQDSQIEQDETVVLTLVSGTGYIVSAPIAATVTIASDDRPFVSVVATDAAAAEAGPTSGSFTVSRSGNGSTDWPLTVFYSVSGTATPGSDYTALSGSVTIPAGASSASVAVNPVDDPLIEISESVVVTLSPGAAYSIGAASAATVTIVSDDRPVVSIVASDATATEIGPTNGVFTVTRTGPGSTAMALMVSYAIGGTATPKFDYGLVASSVTIPAGAASATILVRPINDNLPENNETVALALRPSSSYTIGSPNAAVVTIVDGSPW